MALQRISRLHQKAGEFWCSQGAGSASSMFRPTTPRLSVPYRKRKPIGQPPRDSRICSPKTCSLHPKPAPLSLRGYAIPTSRNPRSDPCGAELKGRHLASVPYLPHDELAVRRWSHLNGHCPRSCGCCGVSFASAAHILPAPTPADSSDCSELRQLRIHGLFQHAGPGLSRPSQATRWWGTRWRRGAGQWLRQIHQTLQIFDWATGETFFVATPRRRSPSKACDTAKC